MDRVALFECEWMAGGPVQEDTGRPGGPVQNISVGGGGGGRTGRSVTYWSLKNIITHRRLSPSQQFSASQDADSISLALNNSCPRSHFHTGNNATVILLSGITVYWPLRSKYSAGSSQWPPFFLIILSEKLYRNSLHPAQT